ncbi:hypothetical protein OZX73_05480 [Bifidobacterium sp. ESL0775]|uniref:hypothetical protein n=1 Tax=Bifidobacterium sp. ESL0775 TaxID=2983230 RepID=UPI0023F79076|nr:hypothetical protein [Bifidobacterium sp. ESL0775]WEV68744.1 hypothetical protein OZX73_05480 [Bifidobacterium sp. ESL0775]
MKQQKMKVLESSNKNITSTSLEKFNRHLDFAALEAILPPVVTPVKLSELSGIPLSTLSEWRGSGDGPAFLKVGRRVMYSREAVLKCLREHMHMATNEYAGEA